MNLYVVSDPHYQQHLTTPWHPEQPARVRVIEDTLVKQGLITPNNRITPRRALPSDLLLCHSTDYVQLVQNEVEALSPHELKFLSTGDVVICSASWEVGTLAAGAVLSAVDLVFQKRGSKIFCNVRPPGHHACASRGMGFCLFNNVALGARYAQEKHKISKVLIVDWDVHHGNGTQEIFYEDSSVFYFSTHEKNLYPFTGASEEVGTGLGIGTTLNCPIEPRPEARYQVIHAFERLLWERMKTFQPDLVMISAGFDSHFQDPLGHLNLNNEDFAILTQICCTIADTYAKGRLISVLEGGYNLSTLPLTAMAHVQAIADSLFKRV